MIKNIKEKVIGTTTGISGLASVLGSWQVCHNVCLGIIALLSIIGITIVGMPLIFLTKVAIPLWVIAFILLLITVWFYINKKCISIKLILLNAGLITAGFPFQPLQRFRIVFWVIGGVLVSVSIYLFIKDKKYKKKKVKIK